MSQLPGFEEVFTKIAETQDSEWNFQCSCKECYWNFWEPELRPDRTDCVSESLGDMKMQPNTTECPSYWSYEVACGVAKGKWSLQENSEVQP